MPIAPPLAMRATDLTHCELIKLFRSFDALIKLKYTLIPNFD